MLTYRLPGTTEQNGVDHDERPTSIRPDHHGLQQPSGAESSLTMVSLGDGAASLTCGFARW